MVQFKERDCCAGISRLQFVVLILYVVVCLGLTIALSWDDRTSFAIFQPLYERSDLRRINTSCDETQRKEQDQLPSANTTEKEDPRIRVLMDLWNKYYFSSNEAYKEKDVVNVPYPPHWENCKKRMDYYSRLDNRAANGKRPEWTLWKGLLGLELGENVTADDNGEGMLYNTNNTILHGPYPPWILGGDEDNLPFTRRVQRDMWVQQHPKDCSDPSVKFLFVNFTNSPNVGLGAQLNAISGMFAVATSEKRVLVLDFFNRADHEECIGSTYGRWTCYFAAETSEECRARALDLRFNEEARKNGTFHDMSNYWGAITWFAGIPGHWGKPWEYIQPTSQVDGKVIVRHEQMHIWWWRAQAIRYLTRYPSEYLCTLLNKERHVAFGRSAAQLVLRTLPSEWPKTTFTRKNQTSLDELVWSHHMFRPWIPRPLTSVHVRQGDKAREMQLFEFKFYMRLAQDLRERFPDVENVWLSTEMQNVVDESKGYPDWKFFYTNIARQTGGTRMMDYETGLGRLKASNNGFVNLMMAVDCDYFVGALGSSWGSVIDGLRSTNGKIMTGMISVNLGQFWFKH